MKGSIYLYRAYTVLVIRSFFKFDLFSFCNLALNPYIFHERNPHQLARQIKTTEGYFKIERLKK